MKNRKSRKGVVLASAVVVFVLAIPVYVILTPVAIVQASYGVAKWYNTVTLNSKKQVQNNN